MKGNSIFRFAETGGNMLRQAANDGGSGNNGSNNTHMEGWSDKKEHIHHYIYKTIYGPYGSYTGYVECLYCEDWKHWGYVIPTGGGYGYADWNGDGYADRYNPYYGRYGGYDLDNKDYEGKKKEYDCNCPCDACRDFDADGNKKPDSSHLMGRISFRVYGDLKRDEEVEQMKRNMEEIGETRWGNAALEYFSGTPIEIKFDPTFEHNGHFNVSSIKRLPGTNEIKSGTIIITIKDADNYKTLAHEVFQCYDSLTANNNVDSSTSAALNELSARLFERILQEKGEVEEGTIVNAQFDSAMSEMLADMAGNDWNMADIDMKKWKSVRRALIDEGYEDIGEDPKEFNTTAIQQVYREYYGSPQDYEYGSQRGYAAGFDDGYKGKTEDCSSYVQDTKSEYGKGFAAGYARGYSDGARHAEGAYDSYGYGNGYVLDNCECECDCPGCECTSNATDNEQGENGEQSGVDGKDSGQ